LLCFAQGTGCEVGKLSQRAFYEGFDFAILSELIAVSKTFTRQIIASFFPDPPISLPDGKIAVIVLLIPASKVAYSLPEVECARSFRFSPWRYHHERVFLTL
jgi:hypothetical protein